MREPVVPQFDAETYLMWESRQRERFELHHGFAIAFAGGTFDHDRISLNLRIAFERLFSAPCRSFGSDLKVRVAEASFYYPDAGVTSEASAGNATIVEKPRIVADVLSPSTRSYDLVEKRAVYREIASIEAYLIVHTSSRHIDIDLRDADRSWRTVGFEDDGVPLGIGTLTLEDVYRRSSLERCNASTRTH